MKSTDVYREARVVLAPWCKANGFKRTSGGMLGWTKAIGDAHLFFWFQVSRDGWDPYAGSKFVVEFQRSATPHMFSGGNGTLRERLARFLTEEELVRVRSIQNAVIRSLTQPPPNYFIFQMVDALIAHYLKQFAPVKSPYAGTHDIWFRYHEPSHVRRWAEFVLEIVPRVVDDLEQGHATTRDAANVVESP